MKSDVILSTVNGEPYCVRADRIDAIRSQKNGLETVVYTSAAILTIQSPYHEVKLTWLTMLERGEAPPLRPSVARK